MGAWRWMAVRMALDDGDVTFGKVSCGDVIGGGEGREGLGRWWGGLLTGRPLSVVPVQAILGVTLAIMVYGISTGKLQKPGAGGNRPTSVGTVVT